MAKDRDELAVEVSELRAELTVMRRQLERERESRDRPAQVIDDVYVAWKQDASRPASERTQDIADKQFGTDVPRFKIRLDSTGEDGKPGPKIGEHFPLTISANSEDEAGARYLRVMGIRKHDYRLVVEPLPALA